LVPIMNQTHVLYIFDNHLLHPLQNQYQVSPDSFSTKAIAKGNNCLLPSAATAVRIVPLYLPVKNVPSIQMTGRQCGNASMQAPKAKNDRWSTCFPGFWAHGYVFKS